MSSYHQKSLINLQYPNVQNNWPVLLFWSVMAGVPLRLDAFDPVLLADAEPFVYFSTPAPVSTPLTIYIVSITASQMKACIIHAITRYSVLGWSIDIYWQTFKIATHRNLTIYWLIVLLVDINSKLVIKCIFLQKFLQLKIINSWFCSLFTKSITQRWKGTIRQTNAIRVSVGIPSFQAWTIPRWRLQTRAPFCGSATLCRCGSIRAVGSDPRAARHRWSFPDK